MTTQSAEAPITSGIVAGHDGSVLAGVAVQKAADLAGRLGAPLHVVRVWSLRTAPRPADAGPGYVPSNEEFEKAVIDELTAHVGLLTLPEGLEVVPHAVRGQSSEALIEASVGAEMLVVGTRGSGGFKGLLLGSTADQVLRHARIPVLVIPNAAD